MAKAKQREDVSTWAACAMQQAVVQLDPGTISVLGNSHHVVGIRIPFALEYLLNCNLLPLGLVFELLGPPGSFKTTFGYEIGRLVYDYSGWTEMFLTEGKVSPHLVHSIMGYMDVTGRSHPPCLVLNSEDMEDWQSQLIGRLKAITKLLQGGVKVGKRKAVGAYAPVHFLVDSVMGQLLSSTVKKAEEGSSGRGYAVEAGSLTQHIKAVAPLLLQGPYLLTLINHQKIDPSKEMYQPAVKNSPGGKQIRFQAVYRIELSRPGKVVTKILTMDDPRIMSRKTTVLRMALLKSSLGDDDTKVDIPYTWGPKVFPDGSVRQYGSFQWTEALVNVLNVWKGDVTNSAMTQKDKANATEKLDQFVNFRKLKGNIYTSKTFKATPNAPMTKSELGKAIQESPEILEQLRDMFNIKRYTLWNRSENYFDVLGTLQQKLKEELTSVPEAIREQL